MRLAIIAGGWHFPAHFYWSLAEMPYPKDWRVDLFCVSHRDPGLPIVAMEKRQELDALPDDYCGECDCQLYASYPDREELRSAGWWMRDEANTVGDWGFFNQWLTVNDYRHYDLLLNCHDDTFIRSRSLLLDVLSDRANLYNAAGYGRETLRGNPVDWLILGNGRYPQAPEAYVRGSFEFWKPRMLELLGGKIDLGNITLTREGLTDSPTELGALMAWNDTAVPVRDFMVRRGLADKVLYLSPYYRISKYVIEGERGFVSRQGGAPWSFQAGLKELKDSFGLSESSCGGLS